MNAKKQGVLLLQLGTPKSPAVRDVKRYLAEFLGDRRVVDLPYVIRMALLHGVILRTRPQQSAKAYAQIWDSERGSPLMFHTQDLAKDLQAALGSNYVVDFAMRYGDPTIESTLDRLLVVCDSLVIIPLFPQYASATTGSLLEKVFQHLAKQTNMPTVRVISQFYQEPGFIQAYANKIQKPIFEGYDRVLMSFHSLPVRQNQQSGRPCYRSQCYQSARLIAAAAGLSLEQYVVVFQSRLGKIPWIGPDVNSVLPQLAQKGDKRLLVVCPSFVADCLETLEEIQIRANATWKALGGESITLIPCLNADPYWIGALDQLIRQSDPTRHSDRPVSVDRALLAAVTDYA